MAARWPARSWTPRSTSSAPATSSSRRSIRASITRTRWRRPARQDHPRFPLVAGIDVAGTVESSSDARFRAGDRCWSPATISGSRTTADTPDASACPPTGWCRCPPGLSAFDVMALGTAGFTAAMSVVRLEQNGLAAGERVPSSSPARPAASAASRVQCLAGLGYQVTAMTGKDERTRISAVARRRRRAAAIGGAEASTRPLEKATWAGAVDPVGGETLAWLTRDDDVRREHRQLGADRRHRPPHDGDPVHPPRRQAARDRLGDVSDGAAARGLAPPGDRHEAEDAGVHRRARSIWRVCPTRLRRWPPATPAAGSSSRCSAFRPASWRP